MDRRELIKLAGAFGLGYGLKHVSDSWMNNVTVTRQNQNMGSILPDDGNALISEIVKQPSIGNLARNKGYVFGTAAHNYLFRDPIVKATVAHHSNSLVCEAAMKLSKIRKTSTHWDFSNVQQFVDYAARYNLDLRGHVLCWYLAAPDWYVNDILNGDRYKVFTDNLRFLLTYFDGIVSSWDVVNEVIKPQDGHPEGLRDSFLSQAFGKEFIKLAFEQAERFSPNTPRLLTEYFGSEGKWAVKKIYHFKKLIDWLIDNKVPVTGIGIHGHLVTSKWIPESEIYALVKHIHDAGLTVMLTELDFRDYDLPKDMIKREFEITQLLDEYLSIISSFSNYEGLMCWGMFDKYSWTNSSKYTEQRADGSKHSATLFDEFYKGKNRINTIFNHFNKLPNKNITV